MESPNRRVHPLCLSPSNLIVAFEGVTAAPHYADSLSIFRLADGSALTIDICDVHRLAIAASQKKDPSKQEKQQGDALHEAQDMFNVLRLLNPSPIHACDVLAVHTIAQQAIKAARPRPAF